MSKSIVHERDGVNFTVPNIPAGMRFDRLVVTSHVIKKVNGQTMHYYVATCDCGNTCCVLGSHLVRGRIKSCGCYCAEMTSKRHTTHGDSVRSSEYARLFDCWQGMFGRCYNEKKKDYCNHGGRGITVCNEWREYPPFKEWALSHGYSDSLTLDRINNDGNYEPPNCRWATRKQQARNTRRNHLLTAFGETKSIAEWVGDYRCVVSYGTLRDRLKSGMSPEEAITKPARHMKKRGGNICG